MIALRSVFDAEAKASVTTNRRNLVKKSENQIKKRSYKNEKNAENIAKKEATRAGISDQELQIFPDKEQEAFQIRFTGMPVSDIIFEHAI